MTFYIGATAIHYQGGFPNPLDLFDKRFLNQVLPVSRTLEVRLREVDHLPIPEGEPVTMGWTRSWDMPAGEIRLYTMDVDKPYMLSIYHGDLVEILYESEGWKLHGKQFRPWFQIHLERALLGNQALVLHSASIIVNGKAIVFSAPSGTGKTTQTDLWHQYADSVEDLNGDRTLLQKTEDGWYACGFPLYGGILRCEQRAVPIACIAIVRRAKTDFIRELTPVEKVSLLYSEITAPSSNPDAVCATMDLITDFIMDNTVIELNCTMERSAVDVLRDYLENGD